MAVQTEVEEGEAGQGPGAGEGLRAASGEALAGEEGEEASL
jgi:hypothetical protein